MRQFQCRVLVATDLAARGIDAEHIDLVVNMDVARDPATYLHRVGRAGRFGASALAFTIACEGDELTDLRSLVTRTGASVRILTASDYLAVPDQTIQQLEAIWPTLPELEGTGLEGQNVTDGLLTDIEHLPVQTGAPRAPLVKSTMDRRKKSNKKPPKSADPEPDPLEESLSRLSLSEEQQKQDPALRPDLSEWCSAWLAYAAQTKALVQQSEYLRLMSEDFW